MTAPPGVCQIDHMVLHRWGLFIIESKSVYDEVTVQSDHRTVAASSAFLCAAAGISPPTIDQAAAYIDGWRKKLKGDKRLVVAAAGAGQRAADLIVSGGPYAASPE